MCSDLYNFKKQGGYKFVVSIYHKQNTTTMNLPKRAEDAHATLAAAFNTGDVETVMSMYDVTGIFVPEPGKPVSGKGKFEMKQQGDGTWKIVVDHAFGAEKM